LRFLDKGAPVGKQDLLMFEELKKQTTVSQAIAGGGLYWFERAWIPAWAARAGGTFRLAQDRSLATMSSSGYCSYDV